MKEVDTPGEKGSTDIVRNQMMDKNELFENIKASAEGVVINEETLLRMFG